MSVFLQKAEDVETTLVTGQEQNRRMRLVTRQLSDTETTVMMLHYGHGVPIRDVTHKLKLPANEKLEVHDYPGAYAQRFDGIAPSGEHPGRD